MALYAGFWGPEAVLWSTSGTPVRDTPVTVLAAATLLPTTLYVDEQKSATVANPTKTDSRGNLSFFAVPGEYYLRWNGAAPDRFIVVGVHPDDPAGGGEGVTDHGLLTGLGDDDHAQYHNNARGDVRYAQLSHTHPSTQITDFSTAVDARIANVIGTAPANLDTLGELADALGDDANFAASVTTSLAGKQPLDADLTTIAALAPSDGSVLARVSGEWNSRTAAQLKTDLALTKADVGLGSVDNTSDLGKPVSTAAQTALDTKLPRVQISDPMTKYGGLVGAPGRFQEYQGVGSFGNQMQVSRCFIPANSGVLTRMTIPVRSASSGFTSTGHPNLLAWWNDSGTFQSATPDDSTMWNAVDWYVATLAIAVPNFTVDTYVYGGFQIAGQTGGGQFALTGANDSGTVPFSHAPGSSKRFCAYSGSLAAMTNFNPDTFGVLTSFQVFLGFLP